MILNSRSIRSILLALNSRCPNGALSQNGYVFFALVPPVGFFRSVIQIFRRYASLVFCFRLFLFAKMVRRKLIEQIKPVDVSTIRLRDLFELSLDDAIGLLVGARVLRNEMHCDTCGNLMNIQRRSKQPDGIWVSFNACLSYLYSKFSGYVDTTKWNAQRSQSGMVLFSKMRTCRCRSLFRSYICGLSISITST
jgi:hypothetical protein